MQKANINIRQRENGSFEARCVINGKRFSRYGKTISEVRRKIRQLQVEAEKGKNVIAKSVKLSVAMQAYLEDIKQCKVKATTYDRVESTLKYHIQNEKIGNMQIGAITPQDIQKLLYEKCQTGLSISSIKKIYNLLGEFFRYAIATKEINYNPMDLVEMPHASKILYQSKEMEVLTVEELKCVISIAEQIDAKNQPVYRYGEAIVLLLNTGLRSGEIRGINKLDIDFNSQTVQICRNVVYAKDRENGGIKYDVGTLKTPKSNREIPLNDRAMIAIKRLLNTTCNKETGYLLCNAKGEIVSYATLQRCYTAILKKAGIQHKGLHSTRHTFATVILKNAEEKGQIKEVSELLGHSQISTTYAYYIKASDEDKRNLLNQLETLVV